MNNILRLQKWYLDQCINDWEHENGISIDTIDNPGWSFTADLRGTALQKIDFAENNIYRSDEDWVVARRSADKFEAFGGAGNLDELIEIFLEWTELR